MRYVSQGTFWVVLGGLAAATLAGELLLLRLGYGAAALLVIVVTGGIGVVFVAAVGRAEVAVTPSAPPTAPADDDPFDDPVEAADRADHGPAAVTDPAPVVPTDPATPVGEAIDDGLE